MLIITKEKKVKNKKEPEAEKCSCGCGQDLTPRDTPYWPINGDIDEKKEVFGEGCREDERVEALRWSSYYRALVRDGVDD